MAVDGAMVCYGVRCVCVRISLRKLVCRSASLVELGGVSLSIFRICGHVLSPPTDASASVNVMSGVLCPSTILRAAVSASALCMSLCEI
jgi:hypothetical protein